ncbi:MAG: hypothetical protein WC455_31080 [Dehalococcoidia bacterium]|jgi:hypothetical protein
MIQVTITSTGRNFLKEAATIFDHKSKMFSDIAEVKLYLADKYGKMPKGRNKIYRDKKDGSSITVGFLYSFWNQDWSHNSKKWYQTDWLEFKTINCEPFDIKGLLKL